MELKNNALFKENCLIGGKWIESNSGEKIDVDKISVNFDEKIRGFIKKSHLAKTKTEQNTSRFAEGEKIDAKVIRKNNKDGLYE